MTNGMSGEVPDDVGVPAHVPGGEFSVGVEEELMLVDDQDALMGAAAGPLVAAMSQSRPDAGVVTGEIYVDQVELNTPVCATAEDAWRALRELRALVGKNGGRVLAAGVHPTAPVGVADIAASPRYDRIIDEYAGLLRTPTAALQVHVGLPDERTAILAYRGLRNRLPLLRALAAGSPYWHGLDSGQATARAAIIRSYPRTTMPPLLRSWDDYVARTESLMRAAEASDHTYVWWEMRPRPLLGTLEVRVMDSVPSLTSVAALTALVQGIARRAVEAPDEHDLDDDVLAVNDHRASRYGLDTRVVDVDQHLRPMREIAGRVVAEARAVLAPDRIDAPLDALDATLAGETEPNRQRRVVAAGGMPALLADLVARTGDLEG
ncbi:YbdK family carboxylate-amine ligase [Nocardioides sp. zg-1228]|uniref:carboxylate-amine ligase n=1 Tax=Nocardioides sp. zg-1228 TaxID=2763008 RepID=UPI001642E56C|nr:YbdK family carboxylate-amine ligase [Nocardioides sp. zg-1228]MBC2933985.1 YbdK family carboxylate-amine ligase [Nocardioides sp. zg-1228]QSF58743.1 YbdK family carboxylate-amine ligase [Nocardioides sp. zg-1228]